MKLNNCLQVATPNDFPLFLLSLMQRHLMTQQCKTYFNYFFPAFASLSYLFPLREISCHLHTLHSLLAHFVKFWLERFKNKILNEIKKSVPIWVLTNAHGIGNQVKWSYLTSPPFQKNTNTHHPGVRRVAWSAKLMFTLSCWKTFTMIPTADPLQIVVDSERKFKK